MKCPICDKKITDYSNDYMEHILMEEHAVCKDEHHFYSYEYVTGSYEECIGNVVFYSHYTNTKEQNELQNRQFKAVLELEREHYHSLIK